MAARIDHDHQSSPDGQRRKRTGSGRDHRHTDGEHQKKGPNELDGVFAHGSSLDVRGGRSRRSVAQVARFKASGSLPIQRADVCVPGVSMTVRFRVVALFVMLLGSGAIEPQKHGVRRAAPHEQPLSLNSSRDTGPTIRSALAGTAHGRPVANRAQWPHDVDLAPRFLDSVRLMPGTLTLVYETHATSLDNEAGVASGWFDVGLSPTGEEQARVLGVRRGGDDLAAVFCSDLTRSYRTAEIAFADRALPIVRDPRLRECDYGALTRSVMSEVERRRPTHVSIPFPGGES